VFVAFLFMAQYICYVYMEKVDSEPTDCVVCLTELDGNSIVFACKHALHTTCFSKYAEHKIMHGQGTVSCPLCQQIIIKIHPQNKPEQHLSTTMEVIPVSRQWQSRCLTVLNVILTLGVSALIYYNYN
jgi:hypothetical protein